jgi:hypothetical protein
MPEPDIEAVVITGAGASRKLGLNQPLPLMGDWSTHLVKALSTRGFGYREMTGLEHGLDGMEFERRLGAFLAQQVAFSQIKSITEASAELPQSNPPINPQAISSWHANVEHHLDQIVDIIRESLYELFAEPNYDLEKAARSYKEMLEVLGVTRGTRFVYATTNYDALGEIALQQIGHRVDWGEQMQARDGEVPVDVEGLVDGLGRSVPVLHLHGRVGWYRRSTSEGHTAPFAIRTTRHNPGYGTPIVMLPDPNKAYDSDDIVSSLWRQFEDALSRAKRVLVIGHSLHDDALVRALSGIEDKRRLAIALYAEPGSDPTDALKSDPAQLLETELRGATPLPMAFGVEGSAPQAVASWMNQLRHNSLVD